MFHLIITLSVIAGTYGSDDVYKKCIDTFTNKTSNDYLIGTWHQAMKFTLFSGLVDSSLCPNVTFAKPTAEELKIYKDKYDDKGYPFVIDENSITSETYKNSTYTGRTVGLYVKGDAEAKYWVGHPQSLMKWDHYKVDVFHIINHNYMVYWDCSFRGNIMWLLTRHRNPLLEDMQEIIKANRKLRQLQTQRFCAPPYIHPKNRKESKS